MGVKCFLLEPIGRMRRFLRRYASGVSCAVDGNQGYHQRWVYLDEVDEAVDENGYVSVPGPEIPRSDLRWPSSCACGYAFRDTDEWQTFSDRIYKRQDTGEPVTLREAPPGAMWWATWCPKNMYWDNKEDENLCVKLPDGTDWMVDSRCNNCTLPEDRAHRCWVREGAPPNVTAGKNGYTCSAGAGSIASPRWHGFLRNGELVI